MTKPGPEQAPDSRTPTRGPFSNAALLLKQARAKRARDSMHVNLTTAQD